MRIERSKGLRQHRCLKIEERGKKRKKNESDMRKVKTTKRGGGNDGNDSKLEGHCGIDVILG